uniref:AT2G47690 protein n=1 Tax=Arabidopsis thaliana TaxID=3702 RepID=C0Z2T2_ARATH|nr:AT2G47690 [Arabidopsis thaliana]
MASGWGITGNKDCTLLREDYLECLHHSKEFQRRNRIYKEEQRKLRAASRKGEEAGDGTHNHH